MSPLDRLPDGTQLQDCTGLLDTPRLAYILTACSTLTHPAAMAANLGMAGNSQMLMQQQQQTNNSHRQMQQLVYGRLVQNTPPITGGWQSGMQINDRLGKTMNLYVCCHFIVCFRLYFF